MPGGSWMPAVLLLLLEICGSSLGKIASEAYKGEISGWLSSAGKKNKSVFQENSWWQMVMALIQESFLLPPLDFSSSQTWKSCHCPACSCWMTSCKCQEKIPSSSCPWNDFLLLFLCHSSFLQKRVNREVLSL